MEALPAVLVRGEIDMLSSHSERLSGLCSLGMCLPGQESEFRLRLNPSRRFQKIGALQQQMLVSRFCHPPCAQAQDPGTAGPAARR